MERGKILPHSEKNLFFLVKSQEGCGSLVSPCRKEGIKSICEILPRRHVEAICHLLHGGCNAVIELVGIVQLQFLSARDLPLQAHIRPADKLGQFAIIVIVMHAFLIVCLGKIQRNFCCELFIIKKKTLDKEAHEIAETVKPRQEADDVADEPAQDVFEGNVGKLRHLALADELLPILPCDAVAVNAVRMADGVPRLLKGGGHIPLRDAEPTGDLRLCHVVMMIEAVDVPLSTGEDGEGALFVEAVVDKMCEGLVPVEALFLLLGREGVLVDSVTNGRGVAEVLVRVVILETVELAQSQPFALVDFDDGERLAAEPLVWTIGGVAGVVVEVGARRFAREFLLVEVICELIHAPIIAQDI